MAYASNPKERIKAILKECILAPSKSLGKTIHSRELLVLSTLTFPL